MNTFLRLVAILATLVLTACSQGVLNSIARDAVNAATYGTGTDYYTRQLIRDGVSGAISGAGSQYGNGSNGQVYQQQYPQQNGQYTYAPNANAPSNGVVSVAGMSTFRVPELERLKGNGAKEARDIIATGVIVALERGSMTDDACWTGRRCTNEIQVWDTTSNRYGKPCKSYHQRVLIDGKQYADVNGRACRDPNGNFWIRGDGMG